MSRLFRAAYGIPPKVYRKLVQSQQVRTIA